MISVISLLSLFIYGELTHDNFVKKDRIYRMINSTISGSDPDYTLPVWMPMLEDLKQKYPEVESYVGIYNIQNMNIRKDSNSICQNVIFYEGDFLNIFSPNFIYGDSSSFNLKKNDCLISRSFSKKNYNNRNPVGDIIVLTNSNDTIQVIITGVIDDFKNTTCLHSDLFVKNEEVFGFNDSYFDLAFILLKENNKIEKLNSIQAEEYQFKGTTYKEGFFFQPLKEVYLRSEFLNFNTYPSGNIKLISVFLIAIFLMFMCIVFNYNLMFIILLRLRIKEFALKRIFGVRRSSVWYGFVSDSVIFVFVAACFAYLLSRKAYSFFDNLNCVIKDYFRWFDEVFISTSIIILIISTTIPMFYSKSIIKYRRIDRLKTYDYVKRKKVFGNIFLGVQILVAFVLLSCTFMIKSQLQFVVNRDLGIKNRELVIMKNDLSEQDFNVFSSELKKLSAVSGVTRIGKMPPSELPQGMTRIKCLDKVERYVLTAKLSVDQNTMETLGVRYIQGEGFKTYRNNNSNCIVSKSVAKQIGVVNIIGHELESGMRIIGVVEDISMVPVRKENYPLLIVCKPEQCYEILVTFTSDNQVRTEMISDVYERIYKRKPKLIFYKEYLKSLYQEEDFMLKYMTAFSSLTLILIFFGFYFYAQSIVDLRSKDVVIRKIHGATVQSIIKLLMKEYLIVFIIAVLIASWLYTNLANLWLSGFIFHINNGSQYYIYPSILILIILVFSILNGVLRLANKNIVGTINSY